VPEPRIFTLESAERALPLVRRIVVDIRAAHGAWREALGAYELAAAGLRADAPEPSAVTELRREVLERAERVDGLLAELDQVGCELKDFERGLVDFYALLDDRLVYLCWRLGEEHVTAWHELDAGYAGRQPIDHTLFQRTAP
jgi:hypothetical protein